MPLITESEAEQTPLERNLETLKGRIVKSAEALHAYALSVKAGYNWLWSLPQNELLDLLNADVAWTLELFAANTATGAAVNAQLDDVGLASLAIRCPVEIERTDIAFNQGTRRFEAVPRTEPEPEPEPDPAPPDPEPLPEP